MKAIRVNESTHQKLSELKIAGYCKSYDDTIKALIDYASDLLAYKVYCQERGIKIDGK